MPTDDKATGKGTLVYNFDYAAWGSLLHVSVPCRNRRLFQYIFQLHRCMRCCLTSIKGRACTHSVDLLDIHASVAVPGRKQTLFRSVLRSHYCVWSSISVMGGTHTCCVYKLMNTWLIYIAWMSPTLNGSSALQCFERCNTIKICNGIMFNFYPGLPHLLNCIWAQHLTEVQRNRASKVVMRSK